jgi:hypothetical protein
MRSACYKRVGHWGGRKTISAVTSSASACGCPVACFTWNHTCVLQDASAVIPAPPRNWTGARAKVPGSVKLGIRVVLQRFRLWDARIVVDVPRMEALVSQALCALGK